MPKRQKKKLKVNVDLYEYRPFPRCGDWVNLANDLEREAWKTLKHSNVPKTPVHIQLRLDKNEKMIRACKHAKNDFMDYFFTMHYGRLCGCLGVYPSPMTYEQIERTQKDLRQKFEKKYDWDGESAIICKECQSTR